MELKQIKTEYMNLQKKYNLPDFALINQDFEIEKIDKESEMFSRIVRKHMMDKVVNLLNFLEMFSSTNPVPKIYMSFMKSMNSNDGKLIDKLYDSFSKISLQAMKIELNYNEKQEAELIKQIFSTWNNNKKDMQLLVDRIALPSPIVEKKEKSYFG